MKWLHRRQNYSESGLFPGHRFDFYISFVKSYNAPGQWKTQAESRRCILLMTTAVKRLKYVLQISIGNTRTDIAYINPE
jgi:hypothetical protein